MHTVQIVWVINYFISQKVFLLIWVKYNINIHKWCFKTSVRSKRLDLTSRVVYEQVVNNVDKSDMFLKYILLFVYVVLTPSVLVSNWLLRPRVRLFICWLQGICTLGVVRLRCVVTRLTSGVYERVHSISRRTLYYIKDLRMLGFSLQQPCFWKIVQSTVGANRAQWTSYVVHNGFWRVWNLARKFGKILYKNLPIYKEKAWQKWSLVDLHCSLVSHSSKGRFKWKNW
jgi:hypothetical protein